MDAFKILYDTMVYCCGDDSLAIDQDGNLDVGSANEWKKMRAKEALEACDAEFRKRIKLGRQQGLKESIYLISTLHCALKEIGGTPTNKDLLKLIARLKAKLKETT